MSTGYQYLGTAMSTLLDIVFILRSYQKSLTFLQHYGYNICLTGIIYMPQEMEVKLTDLLFCLGLDKISKSSLGGKKIISSAFY